MHRRAGKRPKAIEAVFVTRDGRQLPVGSICRECVAEWGVGGLRAWAGWHLGQAIAWIPQLGEVRIVLEGAKNALTDEQRASLLGYLLADRQMRAEMNQETLDRAGYQSIPAEELAQRVSLEL